MKPRSSYSASIKSDEELSKYMDKMHLVEDIFLRDDKLELILNEPAPFNRTNRRTNVLIASEINTYAKIFMHQQFMKLQRNKSIVKILSVNADAFFIVRKSDSEPPFKGIPEVFGNFRNEYPNEIIDEYYSLNSRNYTLKFQSQKTITKCVGFDLTYSGCNLNFESFKKILLDKMIGQESKINVRQKRKRCSNVSTSDYCFTSEIAKKRRIEIKENEILSYPWGYVDC